MIRIANWAAFWGDTSFNVAQQLGEDHLDYLVADYMAEVTMALLARALKKDPEGGFVPDAVLALGKHLPEIAERGIKVVTNAGGLNPRACAAAIESAGKEQGVELKVAYIEGDDLRARITELREAGARDMFTGKELPAACGTLNAYIGARPIAAALAAGADVVITGRCADAGLVLGPLLHEFGWADDDYDLLSAGMLIGHILECGPQATGGLFTDWDLVPGWEDIGYPIAECNPNGTAVITKAAGSGGLVAPGTVAEQILYEIADPGAYVLPDVVCDWRDVHVEQAGPDRVAVGGARGSAPPLTYKATATLAAGFRAVTTAVFAGYAAADRARRAGGALIARAERLAAVEGFEPFVDSSVEVVGAGDIVGPAPEAPLEVVVKIGVRHPERRPVEIFSSEYASFGSIAQGFTGYFAGRPRVSPVIEVFHVLVPKDSVPVYVHLDGERREVEIAAGTSDALLATSPMAEAEPSAPAEGSTTVPLRTIAYARSGDKGNSANIGVIARKPEYVSLIREQVTAARVKEFFQRYLNGREIERFEAPGLGAVNLVLPEVLGGTGGTSTLRYDAQGKSYGAMLLTLPVTVPRALSESSS